MKKLLMIGPPRNDDPVFQVLSGHSIAGDIEIDILANHGSELESLREGLLLMGAELDTISFFTDHHKIRPLAQNVLVLNDLSYCMQNNWLPDEKLAPYGFLNWHLPGAHKYLDIIGRESSNSFLRERVYLGLVSHLTGLANTTKSFLKGSVVQKVKINTEEMDSWEILDFLHFLVSSLDKSFLGPRIISRSWKSRHKTCDLLLEFDQLHIDVTMGPREVTRIEFDREGQHYTYRPSEGLLLLKNKTVKEADPDFRESLFEQQFLKLAQKQLHGLPNFAQTRVFLQSLWPLLQTDPGSVPEGD